MVKSLVLISPTGLIRRRHAGARTRFRVISRIVPDAVLNPFLRTFLTNDLLKQKQKKESKDIRVGDVKGIAEAEVVGTNTQYVCFL